MNRLEPTAILSDIRSNQLECTIHCHEYRCMLRLRSDDSSNIVDSKPDISSLCAAPILTEQDLIAAGLGTGCEIHIPLLPGDNANFSSCKLEHHPCGELVRTAHHLQQQLRERLSDASSGAQNSIRDTRTPLGKYEEFLQRSEAIINELLGAIQQHLRKKQTASERARAAISRKRSVPLQNKTSPPPLNYYSALLKQTKMLDDMPNVTDIDMHNESKAEDEPSDITRVSVTCVDEKERSHIWHAELYPSIVLTVDLPEEFAVIDDNLRLEKWWDDDKQHVLPEIQRRFQQGIDMYQPLFNELDELDANLWILEPSLPARRSIIERRIALLEGGASLVIVLDPEKPRAVPSLVRFVGLTAAAMKAAQPEKGDKAVDWSMSFSEFVAEGENEGSSDKHWSETRSVQENLEVWFGAPLPSRLSTVKGDFLVECGICYTHRLPAEDTMADDDTPSEEGALPDVKCSNATCNKHYHDACLFEWLHSLPTAKNSFDRIFGSCPYCCETVSVSTARGRHT